MTWHRQLLIIAALAAAMATASGAARADIEGQCLGGPCVCPDGRQSEPKPCDFDCRSWCGAGDDSSGSSSGGFVPAPTVDPEQARLAAKAEERRRAELSRQMEEYSKQRLEEIRKAKEEYQKSYQRRLALEQEGRQLDADWANLQGLIAMPPGSVPVDVAQLMPIRSRRMFSPLEALPQLRCIHFHLSLATAGQTVAMGAGDSLPVPVSDSNFADTQLAHFEATQIFDTGQGMAGCDRAEPGAAAIVVAPTNPEPPSTPRILRLPTTSPSGGGGEPDPEAERRAHCERVAQLDQRLGGWREELRRVRDVETLDAADRERWEAKLDKAAAEAWDAAPGMLVDVALAGLTRNMKAKAYRLDRVARLNYGLLRTLKDPKRREAIRKALRLALKDRQIIVNQLRKVVAHVEGVKGSLDAHELVSGGQPGWKKTLDGLFMVVSSFAPTPHLGLAKSILDSGRRIATEIQALRQIGKIKKRQVERFEKMQQLQGQIDHLRKQIASLEAANEIERRKAP